MNNGYPPAFPPGPYDPTGVMRNPGNTIPFPPPGTSPIGMWNAPEIALTWTTGTAPVIRTATWATPVFDLRPLQRGAGEGPPINVQPIWGPGAGGQLFVHFNLGTLTSLLGLNVTVQEFAHPTNPLRLQSITGPQDVTNEFTAKKAAALQIYQPPGSGYPVRYWQIQWTLNLYEAPIADPNMTIDAAYY